MTTTAPQSDVQPSGPSHPTAGSKIGRVVVGSMAAGLITAAILVALPLVPAKENTVTGIVLLGSAIGWVVLAVLSSRLTTQPQQWAAAPAAFVGMAGLASLSGSAAVHEVFSWVWPPALFVIAVSSLRRARRQLHSRGARRLVSLVLVALAVASAGGGYETVRESLDVKAYPPPGRLVDMGGHRLHLDCTGSGGPTVVLEPGLGGVSSELGWIASAVSRDGRVCVYDRAGRGWSDATDEPQDGTRIAADLHTLLERAHEPGPYVLAGHSFGGLYVQSFAAQFPDDVAGMVLLDSTAPKPGPIGATGTTSENVVSRLAALLPAAGHLGVARLIAQSSYSALPPHSRNEARANSSTASNLHSLTEEFLAGNASVHQAASLTSLHNKPLIVLTADTGNDATWRAAQDQLATLSTNSLHRVAHATHQSLIEKADSDAASQAIRDVVASIRTTQQLAPH